MTAAVHIGDVGTRFIATVVDETGAVVDVSTATVKIFRFRKPNGTVIDRAAGFLTNGLDGKLTYASIVGDLDLVGTWNFQVYVELPTGKWHSDIHYLEMIGNL